MSAPARRSGRERKVNPKYSNGGWDKETIRILRASSESSGSSPPEDSVSDEEEDQLAQDGENAPASEDEADYIRSAESQSSDMETPNDDDDNMQIEADKDARGPRHQPLVTPRLPITSDLSSATHSRGITRDILKSAPKETVYNDTFGPYVDDLTDVLRARDTWLKGRDITIPSRQTLSELQTSPFKALSLPSSENTVTISSDEVHTSLSERQILKRVERNHVQKKYLLNEKPSHLAFMGPYGKEQKFNIEQGRSLDFGNAWTKEGTPQGETPSSYHEGWILNLGEKVQTISWAPSNNSSQYLAVACRCTSAQRETTLEHNLGAPAFYPSPPYPSTVQIWKFVTEVTRFPGVRTLNMRYQPTLAMVIETDWGNIQQLRWRPANGSANLHQNNGFSESEFHGVLGVLSSDGHARILSISIPNEVDDGYPLVVQPQRTGFDIAPPQGTIFTTFAFATPTDIILGCANGSIHLFDLTESIAGIISPVSYMTHSLHNTYIIAITPASPSHLSHFVSSVSAAGDLVLVDLRSPEQDHISIHRACFPNRDLVYSPLTHSFITALDRAGNTHIDSSSATFIMCHHIRQFHASHRVAKLPEYSGTATALAASQLHPCILAGNAQGTVVATNFLRKVLPKTRSEAAKAKTTGAYIQKICEYEWRPLARDELRGAGAQPSEAEILVGGPLKSLYHGRDVRPGASRFSEGFKPEKIDVGNPGTTKVKPQKQELGAAEATFEEEQAVTAIEWNVNSHCAGFVAIGWGSGLLRIQDLAHSLD